MDESLIARALPGVSRLPRVRAMSEEDVDALQSNGFQVVMVNMGSVESEEGCLRSIGAALDFPPYFGANWDAFGDCMNEVGSEPLAVLILGWQDLLVTDPALVLRVAHMLASVTQEFAQVGEVAEYLWVLPGGDGQ
jgi:RNAse (barnase) inhibitor barstar